MSGQGPSWAEAFLEMMSVERAAAKNTLTAYARDLTDASGFLAGRGRDLADASAEDVEAYFVGL
ncbi:site-specific integrase, partial [Phenylobacterium sp.]|uniref:site-specific integrase n=1 Tax=Phenylobacterium sp. TaxID=1871053 RepID=UPI00120499DA